MNKKNIIKEEKDEKKLNKENNKNNKSYIKKIIKEMSRESLKKEIKKCIINYENIKFSHFIKKQKNPMKIKFLRKNIARLKTELRKK